MQKKLLTPDYERLIIESFKLPQIDQVNYYSNLAIEYLDKEPGLFDRMLDLFESYKAWANYVHNFPEEFDNQKHLSVDEKGDLSISLYYKFGLNLTVPLSYFQSHIVALKSVQDNLEKQPGREKQKPMNPETLDEIFKDPSKIDPCIDVLRQLDPPLIGKELNYIGKNKTTITVWLKEVENAKHIYRYNDQIRAMLLNRKFPDLDMTKDGSLFRKVSNRAEERRMEIKVLLSRISQNSQSGG
jgi:hypothetical protein